MSINNVKKYIIEMAVIMSQRKLSQKLSVKRSKFCRKIRIELLKKKKKKKK